MKTARQFAAGVVGQLIPAPEQQATAPIPTKKVAPKRERARYKTPGYYDWWTPPPEMPLNAGILSVVSIVDEGINASEFRVLNLLTYRKNGAKEVRDKSGAFLGWNCAKLSYDQIAPRVSLCRKTVRNTIKRLIAKGVLQIRQIHTSGKRRTGTSYFAPAFDRVLAAWRNDEKLFHVAHERRIVVRGRGKHHVTAIEGRETYQIDAARAPRRGTGRKRERAVEIAAPTHSPGAITPTPPKAAEPAPRPAETDVRALHAVLALGCDASLEDAAAVIIAARAEAGRQDWRSLPIAAIVTCCQAIRVEYKPTPQFPRPRPGWFLDKIRGKVSAWIVNESAEAKRRAASAITASPPPTARAIFNALCRHCGGTKSVLSDGTVTDCQCDVRARASGAD